MFCTSCGKHIPDDARFCSACGAPVTVSVTPAAANAAERTRVDDRPASYLERLAAKLQQSPRYIPELDAHVLLTTRLAAALTDMHQYFFIASNDRAGYEEMRAYSEACTSWALDNYQGLPRGLQKGIAIYPVMLQHPIDPNALRYVLEKPSVKFAAFQLAVVLDPVAGEIRYLEKTPVWGYAMWNGIKRAADEALHV